MKKRFAALLIAVSVILAGCGGSSSAEATAGPAAEASTEASKEQEAAGSGAEAAQEGAQEAADASREAAQATAEAEQASAVKPGSETIEEQVLLDEEGVTITAKSLDAGGLFGPEIKLLLENNSGKNLTVQARNASVNGYMIETTMSCDIADGKKANDGLTFYKSDLEAAGIDVIADMEFCFYIFDTESWDEYLTSSMITVETSAAEGFEYTFDDSGDEVFNEDGVRIVVKGASEDGSIFGPGVVLYLENSSDDDITVQVRDCSINGFMVDPIFSSDVMAGKHAVDAITFLSSELEENGIEKIEDVELSFHIFDTDSWDTIRDTDVITLHF